MHPRRRHRRHQDAARPVRSATARGRSRSSCARSSTLDYPRSDRDDLGVRAATTRSRGARFDSALLRRRRAGDRRRSRELTNVPWRVDAADDRARLRHPRASRCSTICRRWPMRCRCCTATSCTTLQEGEALRGGNMALIAAGTGLGQALLHHVDGRLHAVAVRRRPRRLGGAERARDRRSCAT